MPAAPVIVVDRPGQELQREPALIGLLHNKHHIPGVIGPLIGPQVGVTSTSADDGESVEGLDRRY
jgi:hypothetical protein